MHQLPVIHSFIPYFLSTSNTRGTRRQRGRRESWYRVLFRHQTQNTFMCLSTDQLKFLDMTNYTAPGFNYDNGCEDTKCHFRSSPERDLLWSNEKRKYFRRELRQLPRAVAQERHDDIARLSLLVQQSGCGSLSAGHSHTVCLLPATWHRHVQARQGLTLLYLFEDLPEKTYVTLFSEKNKDLHHLVKDHVVGGASLIYHRYQEKGVTMLCWNEYDEAARPCRTIVGYDANALYLWSLMQDMPMGWNT